jgi:hypothetical protein
VSRALAVVALFAALAEARADDLSNAAILGAEPYFRIESVRLRFTHFDQQGHGYQSQAGPSPGLETVTVEQPQLEIVAKQGKNLTHRFWIPVDIVTAASPDATDGWPPPDAVTEASRINEAVALDAQTDYQADRKTDVFVHAGFHVEEPFRSWSLGAGVNRKLADDNATLAASVNQTVDWFDRFNIFGTRIGHASRSSTNANLGLTQLLSPTTIGHLDYGVTVQVGELGNTWNAVPLSSNMLGDERFPSLRHRHALVARLAQGLPWHGAIKGFYRFYVDNWGIQAHTFEVELYQHITPFAYLRLNYRVHNQTGADFFSIHAAPDAKLRTADSDLAPFTAQTIGVKAAVDLRLARRVRDLHIDFGYERYFRSNDLTVNIYTCGLGFRFL